MLMKNKLFCTGIGALKRLFLIILRGNHNGYKICWKVSPQSLPTSNTNKKHSTSYSTSTIIGEDILASPQDKFSFFARGTTIFNGGTCLLPSHPPYFAHCCIFRCIKRPLKCRNPPLKIGMVSYNKYKCHILILTSR